MPSRTGVELDQIGEVVTDGLGLLRGHAAVAQCRQVVVLFTKYYIFYYLTCEKMTK